MCRDESDEASTDLAQSVGRMIDWAQVIAMGITVATVALREFTTGTGFYVTKVTKHPRVVFFNGYMPPINWVVKVLVRKP